MDFHSSAPMPTLEYRVNKLVKDLVNCSVPINIQYEIAQEVASRTPEYSLLGYTQGGNALEAADFKRALELFTKSKV